MSETLETQMTGPRESWTSFNHKYVEGMQTSEGYAFCVNCLEPENSGRIIDPCPKGPVLGRLRYMLGIKS